MSILGVVRRATLLVSLLAAVASPAADFVNNPADTLFPDKAQGAVCPYASTEPKKCLSYQNVNALKSGLLDLRQSIWDLQSSTLQPFVVVSVMPRTATLATSATKQFTTSTGAVTWSASGGTISGSGLYTAPSTPGRYQVFAMSTTDATQVASALVTVQSTAVLVIPTTDTLHVGAKRVFVASTTGLSSSGVTWSTPDGGSVDSAGRFTAPNAAGTYRVTATSVADPTKSASSTVTVFLPYLLLEPATAYVGTGGSIALTATPALAVTWAVTEGSSCGTITPFGVFTAIAAAPAACHVTATPLTSASTPSWQTTTSYMEGQRVQNGGLFYLCIGKGISAGSGGPTTNRDDIVDGTAHWTYITTPTNASAAVGQATVNIASYATPASPGTTVTVAIDSSSSTRSVSPYIFGVNLGQKDGNWAAVYGANNVGIRDLATFQRQGGNRMTAYNWESNWSNAGNDYGWFSNDLWLSSSPLPGQAVKQVVDFSSFGTSRPHAWRNGELVTIPAQGLVSGAWSGVAQLSTIPSQFVGPRGDQHWLYTRPSNPNGRTATPDVTDNYVYQDDFLTWLDQTYPGHKISQTEPVFVSIDNEPDLWGSTHPELTGAVGPVSLGDPDPNSAHPAGTWSYTPPLLGYDDLPRRIQGFGKMVHDTLGPNALTFAPALGMWMGMTGLQRATTTDLSTKVVTELVTVPASGPYDVALKYPINVYSETFSRVDTGAILVKDTDYSFPTYNETSHSFPATTYVGGFTVPVVTFTAALAGQQVSLVYNSHHEWYVGYYLDQASNKSTAAGQRVLDVLDIHLYPQESDFYGVWLGEWGDQTNAAAIDAREQDPRTWWDPTYHPISWIDDNGLIPPCGALTPNCTRQTLRRLQKYIDLYFPGTKIGITEYTWSRLGDMQGAIAQADSWGIMMREGVFAANIFSTSDPGVYGNDVSRTFQCLDAAFRSLLNFNGTYGRVGDTYAPTTVTDPNRPVDPWLAGRTVPGWMGWTSKVYPTQYLERITAYATFDSTSPARAVVFAINKSRTDTITTGFKFKHNATFNTAKVYQLSSVDGTGSGSCQGLARGTDIGVTSNAFSATLSPQTITVFELTP